jgi:hypothetical protein
MGDKLLSVGCAYKYLLHVGDTRTDRHAYLAVMHGPSCVTGLEVL